MKRRDFLKLSAAPALLPWAPTLFITKAPIPEYNRQEWTDFPNSNPISDIEDAIETLQAEEYKYDTITMQFNITDENGNYYDLWSKEAQKTFDAYAIFTSPSGREHVVKCDLNRNNVWKLTSVTATLNVIEKGTWKSQIKLLMPENQVQLSQVTEHEYL